MAEDLAKQFLKSVSLSDTKAVNADGKTSLLLAAADALPFLDVIKALVAAGADINAADEDGVTVLMTSINEGGNEVTAKYLIENGAHIHAMDNDGARALSYAAAMGLDETVKLLLKKGADLEAANNSGETILFAAINADPPQEEMVETLLKLGADPNIEIREGTPLVYAARSIDSIYTAELEAIIDILLKHGVNLDGVDSEGKTALMFAGELGNPELYCKLVEAGADETIEDYEGKLACDYAEEGGVM